MRTPSCLTLRALRSRTRHRLWAAVALVLGFSGTQVVQADAIPYPNSSFYNPVTYAFTAASTGDVIAYFAGTGAAYDETLGLEVNGVLTSAGFGLDNHTSSVGQSFDLGHANAGDTLVFVLDDITLGKYAYSDPSLNVSYDSPGDTIGHNHIYSTAYTATSPVFPGVPVGIYVGFEDLPFPNSDFNYTDETFVFTNVSISTVPEPSALTLLVISSLGGAIVAWKRRKDPAIQHA